MSLGGEHLLTSQEIFESIVRNERIDRSATAFGRRETNPQKALRPFPPVLLASFQHHTGPAAESNQGVPNSPIKSIADFEDLSLAIRQRAFGLDPPQGDTGNSWMSGESKLERVRAQDVVKAICAAAELLSADLPEDDARVLHKAVAGKRASKSSGAFESAQRRAGARKGVQLIGLHIIGDSLNLSNMTIPFSVRLIGCIVDGAVIADRAKLVTLDLSGSIVRQGIYATFLEAHGSVRMRRTVCTGPTDFGGSTIDGTFDASDAILVPAAAKTPSTEVYVGDRGVLNLALATIGNEVRLLRSRIYGGINLRGGKIRRSMFLDDIVVRSPAALLERLAFEAFQRIEEPKTILDAYVVASAAAEDGLSLLLHEDHPSHLKDPRPTEMLAWRRGVERLGAAKLFNAALGGTLLEQLLAESMRSRTSAIRMDGTRVEGSIFANGARIAGRFRMKYATVEGGLHLEGSRLRAAGTIEDAFKTFNVVANPTDKSIAAKEPRRTLAAICSLFVETRKLADRQEPAEHDQYALDLQDSNFRGSIDLAREKRLTGRNLGHDAVKRAILLELCRFEVDAEQLSFLFGPAANDLRQSFDRELQTILVKPKSSATGAADIEKVRRAQKAKNRFLRFKSHRRDNIRPDPRTSVATSEDLRDLVITHCVSRGSISSTLVMGELNLKGVTIAGDLCLAEVIVNLFSPGAPPADKSRLLLERAKIGGDLDLRCSAGIKNIDARQIRIGGSVRLASTPDYLLENDAWREIARRAMCTASPDQAPRGAVRPTDAEPFLSYDFSGGEIGADAVFLFDRSLGPRINLSLARVAGKLLILPAAGPLEQLPSEAAYWREEASLIRFPRNKAERRDSITLTKSAVPTIDLRNASAVVFSHPPSAWPQQDGLVVDGFRYERARDHGPLSPRRRKWDDGEKDSASNGKRFRHVGAGLIGVLAVVGFIALASALNPELARVTDQVMTAISTFYKLMSRAFGIWNLAFTLSIALAWLARSILGRITNPKPAVSKPLALQWLALQRRRVSVVRVKSTSRPLEPYIQAANVLRSSGRIDSANRIELERLRLRRRHLSWRTSFLPRIVLRATDLLTRYGFNTVRAALLAMLLAGIGGCIFHQADRCNLVWPTDASLASQTASLNLDPRKTNQQMWWEAAKPGGVAQSTSGPNAATMPPPYPGFVSLLYAFDYVFPILDFGQKTRWGVVSAPPSNATPEVLAIDRGCLIRPSEVGLLQPFQWCLKILGWVLTTAIAIALITRIETIIARNEE